MWALALLVAIEAVEAIAIIAQPVAIAIVVDSVFLIARVGCARVRAVPSAELVRFGPGVGNRRQNEEADQRDQNHS